MPGLRIKKKELTRKKILDISKQLFVQDGYKKVKTAEIARLAGIGEGTLFNYFPSKSELFITTFFEYFQNGEYISYPTNIVSTEQLALEIINIIDYYLKNLKQIDKGLIREYYSLIYNIVHKECTVTRRSWINREKVIMKSLNKLFTTLINAGIIEHNTDTQTAIACIYGCSITIFNDFVYENTSYGSMMVTLEKQIKFILNGNIKWKKANTP